jgi:hypothetical protein
VIENITWGTNMKIISIFVIGILCISCTNSIIVNGEKYKYRHDKNGKEISFRYISDDKKINLDFEYNGDTKEINLKNVKEEASNILSFTGLNKISLTNIAYGRLAKSDYKNQEVSTELIYPN